ncbi:MAG: transglycosylase family protein [Mycobacteriales bacterium]
MSALQSLLHPRKRARHAKPSKAAPLLAAGGMTVALGVADSAALATSASAGGSNEQFERLAQCESSGNWSINTGNGYYGGIQFSLATWRGIGYPGYPHQASKATQIAAGQKLQGQSGWGQWPACSRKLGLSGDGGNSSAAAAAPVIRSAPVRRVPPHSHAASAPERRVAPRATRTRGAAAGFDGRVMTVADVSRVSPTVRAWQQQMKNRGWSIAVDGQFGPQSSSVARRFAAEKGLRPAVAGTVDRAVFDAAWNAPIT